MSEAQVADLLDTLNAWAASDEETIVLQCWMGVSRSTAAAILAVAVASELTPAQITTALRAAAPFATPNPRIIAIADKLLFYNGELIQAVTAIGRGATSGRGQPFSLSIKP